MAPRRVQRVGLPCFTLAAGAALACSTFGTSFLATQQPRSLRTSLQAEAKAAAEAPAPAPAASKAPSVALVKVNDENAKTTASVLAGFAGALLGGVWLGGALFAASAYYSRKEDDVSSVLKGVATASLEALNFGASLNEKYSVSDSLGSAINEALEKQESSSGVSAFLKGLGDTIKSVDEDIGLKDTFGSLAMAASELAAQAVDKAIELNDEYKITDKIAEQVSQKTKSSQ
mmetsp:Transcript_32851/g.71691  ORF Transcript_32851/g.71691 Transcript_32851/m.71691 type:complete len:231 (+) Transcript_32851:76-768(+)